jgi:osmotically-inducible protein OsmY
MAHPEDVALIDRVEEEIRSLPLVAKELSLTAEHGIIAVSGSIPSYDQRTQLLEAIEHVEGVRQVESSVRVNPELSSNDQQISASGSISPLKLREFATYLNSLQTTEPHSIAVREQSGTVYLSGVVRNAGTRRTIEQRARSVFDDRSVRSDITVQTIPDSTIRTEIERIIKTSLPAGGDQLTVDVSQGVVSISGRVARHEDIDKILSQVLMVHGVEDIRSSVTY